MASKKVFTSLEFGSGAKLIKPKIELVSDANDLDGNSPTFSASAGQLVYAGDTNLYLGVGAEWKKVFRQGLPISTASVLTSTLASNSGAAPPFVVASTDKVANLNADLLDGATADNAAGGNLTIPVRDAGNQFHVGTPTADTHVSNKLYVDNAVQGIDAKESVKAGSSATETFDLTGNETVGGLAVTTGDRVLLMHQTDKRENGIWIANTSAWTRPTADDTDSVLTGGSFIFVSEGSNANKGFICTNKQNDDLVADKILNGTGTIQGDPPTSWTAASCTLSTVSNKIRVTVSANTEGDAKQTVTGLTIGQEYLLQVSVAQGTAGGQAGFKITGIQESLTSSTTTLSYYLTATATSHEVVLTVKSGTAGYHDFSTVTLKPLIEFTQFSGAGQISVTSTIDALNDNNYAVSSTAGPLIKSNDTIDFGYNSIHFDVDTNKNLRLKEGGVKGSRLEDNAVDADKLNDSATFIMAGLGIGSDASPFGKLEVAQDIAFAPTYNSQSDNIVLTRDATTGDNQYAGSIGFSPIDSPNERMVSIAGLQTATDSNQMGLAIFTHPSSSGATDIVEAMRIEHDGRVAISSDATSPSGTLHVSTARYGGELFDAAASVFTSGTYSWIKYSNNTIANVSNTLAITYVDDHQGAYLTLNNAKDLSADLVVGRKYRIRVDAKYTGGSSGSVLYINDGSSNATLGTLTTSLATYTHVFTANTTTSCYIRINGMSANNVVTIDNLSLQEDNLAAGVDSDGDDLVVSGKDETGISIISQANTDAGIYFGDGLSDAFSKILSKRALDGTGTLKLDVNSSTALEIDNSQNVKIPNGGLGIGTAAGNNALSVTLATNDQWAGKIAHTSTENGYGLLVKGGNASTNISLEVRDKDDANLFTILGDGNASFPNGNLAIGGTTAAGTLHVQSGSAGTITTEAYADDLIIENSDHVGLSLRCPDAKDGFILFQSATNDRVARISAEYNGGDENLAFAVADDDKIVINDSGTQDHKANSIVNSATVQGLQDGGACYDFDGTDDYIESGKVEFGTSDFSYGCWVKFDSFVAYSGLVCNRSLSGTNIGTELRIGGSSTNLELFTDFGSVIVTTHVATSTLSTGRWYHLVAVLDRSDKQYLYIDGVLADSDSISSQSSTSITNADNLLIGKANASHNGQIRDVKIFPSALTAGDVRKLYSGENPKKNLNVELVTNGTFDSDANWTDYIPSSNGTVVISGGRMVLTQGDSSTWIGAHQNGIKLTSGKTYHVKGTYTGGSSNGRFYIGPSAVSGSYFNPGNLSGTDGVSYDWFFTASTTDTNAHITLLDGQGASSIGYWDDVSITEVGTLVDFNSQSASSTKWYNQAIPALYNGTLNGGVTLSAGNTYWNNIKQDGEVITLNGSYNDATHTSYKVGIKNNDPQDTLHIGDEANNRAGTLRLAGFANNEYWRLETGTNTLGFKDYGDTQLLSLNGATDSVQVHGKLGVGGDAGTETLLVTGSNAEIRVHSTNENVNQSLISIGSDLHSTNSKDSWIRFYASQASTDNTFSVGNISGKFKFNYIATRATAPTEGTTVLTLDGPNNRVGIGTASPANLLHVSGADESMLMLQANTGSTGDKCHIGFGCSTVALSGTNIGARISFERLGGKHGRRLVVSHTTRRGTLTERFVLKDDGTQNHQANRIVNSQTVSDLHRTAEPSLRFVSPSYVACGDVSPIEGDLTISTWAKPIGDYSHYNTLIARRGTGTNYELFLNITSGALSYYNGSLYTSSYVPTADKWTYLAATVSGTTLTLYADGVSVYTATIAVPTAGSGSQTLTLGTYSNEYFKGEIKDVRIHNRALDSDEVAAAYNGESTPFKYANSSTTERVEANSAGSGTAWTGASGSTAPTGWNAFGTNRSYNIDSSSGSGAEPALRIDSGAAGSAGIKWGGTTTVGKAYKVTVRYKHESGAEMKIGFNDGATTVVMANATSWTTKTFEWTSTTATAGNAFYIQVVTANHEGWVDSVTVYEAGEVAAYTPKSIGRRYEATGTAIKDKWFDETSNANHGTITGATSVGNTGVTHYGDLDMVDGGKLRINKQDGLTPITSRYTQYNYGNVDTTPNNDGWSIKLATVKALDCVAGGAVTATSGTSGNLKQVARVHSETITADSTNKIFRITHNLGTRLVVVQVAIKNAANDYRSIEVAHRAGDWLNAAAGTALMNNGPVAAGGLPNYTTLEFVTPPAADIDVTVIG